MTVRRGLAAIADARLGQVWAAATLLRVPFQMLALPYAVSAFQACQTNATSQASKTANPGSNSHFVTVSSHATRGMPPRARTSSTWPPAKPANGSRLNAHSFRLTRANSGTIPRVRANASPSASAPAKICAQAAENHPSPVLPPLFEHQLAGKREQFELRLVD